MPFAPLPSHREIAARCGVSRSTVGHILSGREHMFKAETRDLVLRVAAEMGWKPPAGWRETTRARFGCAVLLQGVAIDRSYITLNLRAALEDRFLERNMHMTSARLPDDTLCSEVALSLVLRQWSADGIVINYTHAFPPAFRRLVARLKRPVVWLNRSEPVDAVRPDDEDAGAMAARLLLEAGHRHIAYLGFPFAADTPDDAIHASLRQRRDGARRVVEAAGARFVDHTSPTGGQISHWMTALTVPDRPTAVICFTPIQVTPVLFAALSHGLSVPRQLSLITFHDEPVSVLDRTIASLDIPNEAIADAVVAQLCGLITGGPSRALGPIPFTVRSTDTIASPSG